MTIGVLKKLNLRIQNGIENAKQSSQKKLHLTLKIPQG